MTERKNRIEPVLEYWFGDCTDETPLAHGSERVRRWFAGADKTDMEIRDRFAGDLKLAEKGKLRSWEQTPRGRLALVTLFDQFSRHIWRGHPKAFKNDAASLRIVLKSLEDGADRELRLFERLFFYLPLMHSEDLAMQDRSRRCYNALAADARRLAPHNTPFYDETMHIAIKHYHLIRRFGRYPHRNEILRRPSTPEEYRYLKTTRGPS